MKRHLKILLSILLISLLLFALCACNDTPDAGENPSEDNSASDSPDNKPEDTEQLKDIIGVSFSDASFSYDGNEKRILVQNIPSGIEVKYTNNFATDAGEYSAKAELSGKGYKPLTLTARLTISKIDLTGISLTENEKITEDGEFHLPTVNGILPSGVKADWYFNNEPSNIGVKGAGSYDVRLVLTGKNYNSLEITSKYKISKDLSALASTVISSLGRTPDTWSFLPDSFKMQNLVIDKDNIPTYTEFTSTSAIPKCYIGKQMNVVYGLLNKCDSALGYIDTVYSVINVIEQAYNAFLNDSPENYQSFSGSVAAFDYSITLSDKFYVLSASIGTVNVEIYSDLATKAYGAFIALSESNSIKYELSDRRMKLAMNVLNSSSVQIEFVRDSSNNKIVNGYIYEYLTVAGKEIVGTSAYLMVDELYTTVIGTKGDFIPTANARNCEVYLNSTAAFVGSEVSEVIGEDKSKAYDTMWINLYDISGITSIKKLDEANVLNPDTVYINGKSDTIHTKTVSLIDWSRRFDIEFKTVCAYIYDEATGEYTEVEFEVPLMFIQEDNIDSFNEDFEAENDVAVTLNVSRAHTDAIIYGYTELLDVYNTIKETVSQEDIINYCKSNIT